MKLTLKQMILNEIDNQPRGYADELAKLAGYSSGSALRKVLNDDKKEFEKFFGLTKIVQELFPKDELNILSDYALTLDPNKQSARFMLEYAELNSLWTLRKELIDRMIDCGNVHSREIAYLHDTDNKYIRGEIKYLDVVSKYVAISPKAKETFVYSQILRAYCYADEHMFDLAEQIVIPLENIIKEIKDEFLSDVYLGRVYLILAECYNRKDSKEKARQVCNDMINNIKIKRFVAWGLLQLGNSYMFESYEKSNKYLTKGFMLSHEIGKNISNNLKRSLNFLDNLWEKNPRYLDFESKHTSDTHEVAFYFINNNQIDKAIEILNKDDMLSITLNQRGFHFYLKGLISNRISDFAKSVTAFKESGDYFYRTLPLKELQKLNVDSSIIEALAI